MTDPAQTLSAAQASLAAAKSEIAKVIYGQDEVVERTMIGLLAGGHILLVGVPGLAKTLLVDTVASVFGLKTARIQCTPDLLPGDILGTDILDQDDSGKRNFRFIEGPVFTQLLMADEINRASPRTQSALLQAMQERSVTVNGQVRQLPTPFHVLATQNPIEQEGTYPMPEAQLDRFLMQIDVDYPSLASEREMLIATTSNKRQKPETVLSPDKLLELQNLVREIPVGEQILDAVLKLVRSARPDDKTSSADIREFVAWAPGPRAAQSLILCAKARALLDGRGTPSVDDIVTLAEPVLKHRMALNYKARTQNITLNGLIRRLAQDI